MKYLVALLSVCILAAGCSGNEPAATDPAGDTAIESTDSTEENSDTSADSESEESEEADTTEDDADGEDEEDSEEDEENDTEGIEQRNAKLIVKDQTTAGQIVVEMVATGRDGWVSVHRSEENGGIVLPDSIGEERVDSGEEEDVIVDLWEAPDVGEKLWVLLHIDAGDRGTYEYPGPDQPVINNGETLARSFVIEDPNEDEEDE